MSLFDIESKKEELKKLEEQTQQESFWQQDTSISSKVLAKIKELKHKIDEFELAQNEASNLIELTELANLEVDEEVAKDICMQIAAARPEFVKREEVPAERVEKEMEILKIQTMNEGKPEAIAEKIVQGRIGKFYEEICLVDQVFVKDSSLKVSELLKQKDGEVVEFARFEKGEGIEKKEENFAEEVMNQLK